MQRAGKAISLALLAFFLFLNSPSAAAIPGEVVISPEKIVIILPKSSGQEYKLSSTANPMKVIIDSNLPLAGFKANQSIADIALREIRYFKAGEDQFRLVLDFNYYLPQYFFFESNGYLQVEVEKTFRQSSQRSVVRGVIYGHERRADSYGPNLVNYLKVDLAGGNEIKLALAQDRIFGSEHVSTLAERAGAVAAVNGAFFAADGRPVGILMIDGEIICEPYAQRTALGLGPDGAVMERVGLEGHVFWADGSLLAPISGINRARQEDNLIIYTPQFGATTGTNIYGFEATVRDGTVISLQTGNSPIPSDGLVLSGHGINKLALSYLQIGDQLSIEFELSPPWHRQGISQIIGGGPRLVRDGQLVLEGENEYFRADVLVGRAPRTALGITEDGHLLLVTVNGRRPNISVGMTLQELGRLLIELGAVQAMNLDGGGSTTMVIHDLVLNLPSGGEERPVSNAIVIITPESR